MHKVVKIILVAILFFNNSKAQVLTSEDSLANGFINRATSVISGYGEANYTYDVAKQNAQATLKRNVLFIGHRFTNKISLFSELEVEDAVASEGKGEISMEQAFIKMDIKPNTYFVAGLFIPRIGIINENHLSTTINSIERPFVEQFIIPTTWREIGIGFYTQPDAIPGLYISAALQNGLNAEKFVAGQAIREARFEGSKSSGFNLGSTLALLYYKNNWRLQTSMYYGGSTAVEKRVADSIALASGAFANAVLLTEANVQYTSAKFSFKILGAYGHIKNAYQINTTYANNTPYTFAGAYTEAAYKLFTTKKTNKNVSAFTRYEYVNTNLTVPQNGIIDDAKAQHYIIGGLVYKPTYGVAIKANYVHRNTGKQNPALMVTPFPQQVPYFTNNGFVQLGIAYNF